MNTPRKIERMSGYRQAFVQIQPDSLAQKEQDTPSNNTINIEEKLIIKEEEISTFDGKEIYSFHPNVKEVTMSDKSTKSSSK